MYELQNLQPKWGDVQDTNEVDSPCINTNPMFQPYIAVDLLQCTRQPLTECTDSYPWRVVQQM